jgi:hypothetical protein
MLTFDLNIMVPRPCAPCNAPTDRQESSPTAPTAPTVGFDYCGEVQAQAEPNLEQGRKASCPLCVTLVFAPHLSFHRARVEGRTSVA